MPGGTCTVRCAHIGAQCIRLNMARHHGPVHSPVPLRRCMCAYKGDVSSARTQVTWPWLHVPSKHRGCMCVSSSGVPLSGGRVHLPSCGCMCMCAVRKRNSFAGIRVLCSNASAIF